MTRSARASNVTRQDVTTLKLSPNVTISLSLSTAMTRTRELLEETLKNLPDGWESYTNALKDLDAGQRAAAVAHLCQQLGVTENQVKKNRLSLQSLPSLPSEQWAEVAPQLGFPSNVKDVRLERFAPPMCLLPPSMHKAMFKEGWRMMDVFQERTEQDREATRLKLLESVSHVHIPPAMYH